MHYFEAPIVIDNAAKRVLEGCLINQAQALAPPVRPTRQRHRWRHAQRF